METENRLLMWLQIIFFGGMILYFGRALFIPLSLGVLLAFVLYPVSRWLLRLRFPPWLSFSLPVILVFAVAFFLIWIIINQILTFTYEWEPIKLKAISIWENLGKTLSEKYKIGFNTQEYYSGKILESSGSRFFNFVRSTLFSFSESLYTMVMAPIFATLILFYRKPFTQALLGLFSNQNPDTIKQILLDSINTYYQFVKGMVWIYLLVGILNSIGLALIGVPNPITFGFIASILTFVPYIGIMVASLLPIGVAWVTFDSILYPIYVILVFAFVQILEAYVLFPYIVGNRLKINTMAVFVGIVIGGLVWGAAGMILFIPMISILKLFADRFPAMKTISRLLS